MKRLLVVDDDEGARASLRAIFSPDCHVELAVDAADALKRLEGRAVDLVLLDVVMPKKDGVTLLKELAELYPDIPVIMVSASGNIRPVVESIKSGAVDFVTKPFNVDELRHLVARVLERHALRKRVRALESDMSRALPMDGLIGTSKVFLRVLDAARKAAETDAPVLVRGESGTGKELMARRVHDWSARAAEPFVAFNCAAVFPEDVERELFGREREGAPRSGTRKSGRLDLAGAGTLFLDGVDALPLSLQMKLLRVVWDGEYLRPGEKRVRTTEARIMASTRHDLAEATAAGSFLRDLFGCFGSHTLHLPPLRDRPGDIPPLAEFLLSFFRADLNVGTGGFSPRAMEALKRYDWPGNLRELRNVVERTLVLHGDETILGPELLPDEFLAGEAEGSPDKLSASVEQVERQLLIDALRKSGGVQTRAAERLGTTRRILKYKMDKHRITLPLEEEA